MLATDDKDVLVVVLPSVPQPRSSGTDVSFLACVSPPINQQVAYESIFEENNVAKIERTNNMAFILLFYPYALFPRYRTETKTKRLKTKTTHNQAHEDRAHGVTDHKMLT